MSKRIHKLSALLINQIAAGEVVTRPASVVKELIENAIDANAKHIQIYIEQAGLGLIQIIDDGDGIHPDDMLLAVTRHATSKLADVEQLTGIQSLGFRGEALASIVAVSHLTLISSHDNSGIGQQLTLSGNTADHAKIQAVVKTQGTTVRVRDLYYNVPARRASLKSIATEFHHIEQIVQKLAISFAHIQMDLYHQNKLRFHFGRESNDHLQRLAQIFGMPLQDFAHHLQMDLTHLLNKNQENQKDTAKITGWLFLPPYQLNQLPKLIYINQRLVTDLTISQTLNKIAKQHNWQTFGYALFFQLPKHWVNANIHPSKQQVKIQPLTNILTYLQHILNEKFKINPMVQSTALNQQTSIDYLPKSHKTHHQVKESKQNYQITHQPTTKSKTLSLANHLSSDTSLPKAIYLFQPTWCLLFYQQKFYLFAIETLQKHLSITHQTINLDTINQSLQRLSTDDMAWLETALVSVTENDMIQWLLNIKSI